MTKKHAILKITKVNLLALIGIFVTAFLPGILLQSCQEKIDWELEMENELRLVVEGKITNERKSHEVSLTLPVYEINGEARPVRDAEVWIWDGDTIFNLNEDPGRPGVYLTGSDVQGVVNKTYYLHIKIDQYEFLASTSMKAVTPIRKPTTYKVSDDPELYELAFTGSDEASMIKLEMDWSHIPGYTDLEDQQNHAVIYGYYFDRLSVDVNEMFSPAREQVRFPPGTRVIITKESLSDGYAEYLRGMLSETAWNGGLFDVKPGDPVTNLSAGALGYFAASTVITDTLTFWP